MEIWVVVHRHLGGVIESAWTSEASATARTYILGTEDWAVEVLEVQQ